MPGNKLGKMVITGGAGFVGSHAAEYFAKKGYEVTILDDLSRPALSGFGLNTKTYNWDHLSGIRNVSRVKGTVLKAELVDSLVKDADAVLHTAGQVAVTTSLTDPKHDFDVNVRGTFNLLEACRKASSDADVLFCSTNKVYGENVNSIPVSAGKQRYKFDDRRYAQGIPVDFGVDHCKHSPYGASKLAADLYLQEYGRTYDLRTACFRMSCIYGDRQFGSEDQGWVAHFVISALVGRAVTIYGDGKQVRDILFVDDLVRAYDAFLKSGLPSSVFNIGGGAENTISLVELVGLLEERFNRKMSISYGPWRNSDQKVYISDISRTKELLKWRPDVSTVEGVEKLIKWAEKSIRTNGVKG